MKMLLCLSLFVMFILQSCVVYGDFCGHEVVSGIEGGDVILRIKQTRFKKIEWIISISGEFIVRTEPGRSINESEVSEPFRGRVRSEDDGSLHIYNLSLHDPFIIEGCVKAKRRPCRCFILYVYERLSPGDITVSHTITRNDTCSLRFLCSVDKPDVTETWSNVQNSKINVSKGVLYVPPSDVNFIYICTARNPVSNVSQTVIPAKYCKMDSSSELGAIYITRWILSGIVFLITGCVLIHHIKTEVMKPSAGHYRRLHR